MSTSTASESAVKRAHNFNAGPGALPVPVLERIREELLDWRGSGMSVMEMSHRSPEFEAINAAAEAGLPRAASAREADDLLRDAETFLSLAETALGVDVQSPLPLRPAG